MKTKHCWINFHFENLEYDDTYIAGDFYSDDNDQYHCTFRYDRATKTYKISNNMLPVEEILPLPMGYLEWKLKNHDQLDRTVWKISM